LLLHALSLAFLHFHCCLICCCYPHLSSLATIASHRHSPHMSVSNAVAFHYLMPFPSSSVVSSLFHHLSCMLSPPFITTCFVIITPTFCHPSPHFLLIFVNPTFHCHIIHHFYVTLVVFAPSLCSLGITFCPFL
jgi:hypothetical protein